MSPAKTCSEIFTASLHLIEVLAATTTVLLRLVLRVDALDLVLARVQFYDQSGVSTLESGFRGDHCFEGPGPGFGKWFGARLAK